ncbi:uncharacterized protein LOC119090090 [Pollicipes pollicipes]|uniref:uncharacterized protein LOC119090090 n=1 Tax=Pollicipes pollicipes TaxID=41117 RepID=UPI001885329A|nr:uncharacterized protein LOC119090090 [Pollicipes pollicipes]
MPRSGKVNEVVQEWLVKEDGALASRLQDEEITEHYQQNRLRNGVIRADVPRARSEQLKEDERAAYKQALHEQKLYEQYAADADVARRLALEARLLGLEAPVRELRLVSPPGAERVYSDDDLSDLMAPPPALGQPLSEDDVRSWQEEQDEEVARLLQEQETKRRGDVMPRDKVAAIEAQDRELAKVLQEQERARLRRAKERAALR